MSRLADLARQVEYYFTKQNLSTDTYLKTLRQLNDGCVPISILANFARVRAMTMAKNRENAIVEALSKHSTLLSIYTINTTSGKRRQTVDDDSNNRTDGANSANSTILAVGLANEGEYPPDTVGLALISKDDKDFTNTIILRDVPASIGEEEIRALFEAVDGCPPVINVCAEVGQCWFVKLDAMDRTDMMKVMLAIRSLRFPSTGEYVLARLKASGSIQQSPPTRRGRRKRRGKRSKKTGSVSPVPSASPGVIKSVVSLPCLTSDQFPALQYNTFEWDTAPTAGQCLDDDDITKEDPKSLDAASTATTTSSTATHSSVSGEKLGYAAALMKTPSQGSAPPVVQEATANTDLVLQWNTISTE